MVLMNKTKPEHSLYFDFLYCTESEWKLLRLLSSASSKATPLQQREKDGQHISHLTPTHEGMCN